MFCYANGPVISVFGPVTLKNHWPECQPQSSPWMSPRGTLCHCLWEQLYDCPQQTPGPPSLPVPPSPGLSQTPPLTFLDQGRLRHYSQTCRSTKGKHITEDIYTWWVKSLFSSIPDIKTLVYERLMFYIFHLLINEIYSILCTHIMRNIQYDCSLTLPVSLRQTVCMPPAATCTMPSGSVRRAGFFRSMMSSPRPSWPTSPWPSTRTCPGSFPWLLWDTGRGTRMKKSYITWSVFPIKLWWANLTHHSFRMNQKLFLFFLLW